MEINLPKGWIEVSLEEILISLESGSRPKGGVRGISDGIPSLGGEHLNYDGSFDFSNIKYVPKQFAANMNKGQIEREDILIVKDGATTGKTSFVDENFPFKKAFVNEHVFICRPAKQINSKYLFWYLWSDEGNKRILENFKGSAQGGINKTFAPNTFIPLAPLPEQQRIVEKLDALMARINNSKARLEKIPVLLKNFRQSVLAAAVSGELTKEWREENKVIPVYDYKEFPNNSFIGNEDLPDTWSWIKVEDYLINYDKGRIPVSQEIRKNRKGEFPYYGATGIIDNINGYTHEGEFILLSEDGMNLIYRTKPQALIASGKIWVNNHAHVLKSKDGFENRYATYCFNTIDLSPYLTGIDQVKLTQGNLNRIPLPIPPKEEQKEIVRKVEELFHFADSIEVRYQKAKAWFDKLPQSLLAKAFRGELVPQNENDEPASELLKRIQQAKQNHKPSSKANPRQVQGKKTRKMYEDNDKLSKVAEG